MTAERTGRTIVAAMLLTKFFCLVAGRINAGLFLQVDARRASIVQRIDTIDLDEC